MTHAVVVGTGMMGPGIAAVLVLGGRSVTMASRTEEGAARGVAEARRLIGLLVKHGLAAFEAAHMTDRFISGTVDLDLALRDAELVIESGPEDMEWKQAFFAHLDEACRPDAVLATNTSGLSITAIASRCQRPERVLTAHFWNPPHLMPLVELVKGERTSDTVVESLRTLLLKCGKTPVVVKKDRPGQLGNRLQMALVREAVHILSEGIADAAEIDLAARMGFGLRLPAYGILEHQDMVGLDLGFRVMDYVGRDLCHTPGAPALYHEKLAQGELGAKSGRGFYDWSEKDPKEVAARRDQFVIDCLKRAKSQPS